MGQIPAPMRAKAKANQRQKALQKAPMRAKAEQKLKAQMIA